MDDQREAVEVVALRDGRDSHDGAPLFVAACSGLTTELAAVLECYPAVACYGLCVPADAAAPRTLQGIAAACVRSLRRLQPTGPYRVLGLAEGGLVAYEMARLLVGQDQTVALVGLVGTECLPWAVRTARLRALSALGGGRGGRGGQALTWAALQYDVAPSPLAIHLYTRALAGSPRALLGWDAVLTEEQLHVVDLADTERSESNLVSASAVSVTQAPPTHSRQTVTGVLRAGEAASKPMLGGSDSLLVTVQRGAPGVPVLCCVPGAGAGAVDFIGLAGALGSSWQLYGFNPRGLDATRLPHSSVEAAAKAYARELVEKLPYVDIHLLGHSFGGWVALELALLLGESGRRVASLTLVDSECPGRPARDVTRPEVLAYLGHLYELAAKRSLGITLEALEARAPDAQLAYLHAALVRGELISKRSDPATIRGAVSTFEAAIRAEYTPQASFNGAAQLLLVPRQGETEGDAALRMNGVWTGWQQFVPKLRLRHSAGDHIAILRAPHVQAIADSLNEVRVDTGRQAAEPHERWTRPDGMGTGRLSL